MIYEHRTYVIPPGKMDAILARFRDDTFRLFEKHGIGVVGFWTTDIGEEGDPAPKTTLPGATRRSPLPISEYSVDMGSSAPVTASSAARCHLPF